MRREAIYICLLFSFWIFPGQSFELHAQEIQARLEFQQDTMAVGKPVGVRMAIKHPSDVVVIFPESRAFAPFELVSFEPEPTQTLDGYSWDVVEYKVRSFQLQDKQALRLPYAYYMGDDTVRRFIKTDSIRLNRRVTGGKTEQNFLCRTVW